MENKEKGFIIFELGGSDSSEYEVEPTKCIVIADSVAEAAKTVGGLLFQDDYKRDIIWFPVELFSPVPDNPVGLMEYQRGDFRLQLLPWLTNGRVLGIVERPLLKAVTEIV